MLIRLSKPSAESGGGVVKPLAADTVTVACPEHLVLADLPVAKGIGTASATSVVKTAGRSCDERIQKIQTIKIMEGIFICAAPHCLKSFLKRTEFESHIQEIHADLLQPNAEENGNDSEVQSAKQQSVSESTARAPSKPLISPVSSSQFPDFEDKTFRQQPSEQSLARSMVQLRPPSSGQGQDYPSDNHPDNSCLPGFDHPGGQNYPQRSSQWGPQEASNHLPDKQQGILSEYPPMHPIQPPNFGGPLSSNPLMTTQYGLPPFRHEGGHPFYGAQYEMAQMARPDSVSEAGAEQGSLFGFPPGTVGSSFMSNCSQPWRTGPGGQGIPAAFPNMSDSQGNVAFHQGDNVHNPGVYPIMHPPPSANQGMEAVHGVNAMDTRDSKAKWEPQQFPLQPPPPPPHPVPHLSQPKRGEHYPGDMGHDGQSFGWQRENCDGFGSGRE